MALEALQFLNPAWQNSIYQVLPEATRQHLEEKRVAARLEQYIRQFDLRFGRRFDFPGATMLYFRLGQCHSEHGCIINRWSIKLWKLNPQSIGLLLPIHYLVGSEEFELRDLPWSCCS